MSKFNEELNKKAVALRYDKADTAPMVVASGAGYLAEKMVELAAEHDIPVYEDASLTTMLSQLQLGATIPEELYNAIVDIYVYFLNFSEQTIAPTQKEEPTDAR